MTDSAYDCERCSLLRVAETGVAAIAGIDFAYFNILRKSLLVLIKCDSDTLRAAAIDV